MKREDKFPDTSTFHYYNANPHNRKSDDCVIRAISTATGKTWEQVLRDLTEIALKTGFVPTDLSCYSKYLDNLGWTKHRQPKKIDNTKYTGEEFCRLLSNAPSYPIIAHIGGHHLIAIIDNKVNDIWNSTDGCIGNYWTK